MELIRNDEKVTFAWKYLYLRELTNQHKPRTTTNYKGGMPEGGNIERCRYYYYHYIHISNELQCRYRLFDVIPKAIRHDLSAILADIQNYYTPQHRLGNLNGAHCYDFAATVPFPEKDDVIEKLVSKPKGQALNFWNQELFELIHETKVALFRLELMLPRVSYDINLFLTPMVGNGLTEPTRKSEPLKSFTFNKLYDARIINTFVEFEDLCCLVMGFLQTLKYAFKDLELVEFIAQIETLRAVVTFQDFLNYQIVHVKSFDTRDITTDCVKKLDALIASL